MWKYGLAGLLPPGHPFHVSRRHSPPLPLISMGALLCGAASGVAPERDAPPDDDNDTHPTVLLAALRGSDSGEIVLEGGATCPPLATFPRSSCASRGCASSRCAGRC